MGSLSCVYIKYDDFKLGIYKKLKIFLFFNQYKWGNLDNWIVQPEYCRQQPFSLQWRRKLIWKRWGR